LIGLFHVEQSFPETKPPEQGVKNVLNTSFARQPIKSGPSKPKRFCNQDNVSRPFSVRQSLLRFLDQTSLAPIQSDRALGGQDRLRQIRHSLHEIPYAGAGHS